MTDPVERPDPSAINDATRRAVEADRARAEAATRAARRRRSSPMGRLDRGWRWLRNRQTGPIPRLRRVGSVLKATVRERGPWRSLPDALATALLAPVRQPSRPAPPRPPRDLAPERAAAAARLATLAADGGARTTLAVIADATELGAWSRSAATLEVRPEDWRSTLDDALDAGAGPHLLVVTSARDGNHGAWAYRIGWVAHPDALLHRDLARLVEWCAAHDVPSVFVVTDDRPEATVEWGDAADLFDLVLAPSEARRAAFAMRPERRGVEPRATDGALDLARLIAAIGTAS